MNFNFNSLLDALSKAVKGLGERVNNWGANNFTGSTWDSSGNGGSGNSAPPLYTPGGSYPFIGGASLKDAPQSRAKNFFVGNRAEGETPSAGPSAQGFSYNSNPFLAPSYTPYTPPSIDSGQKTVTAPAAGTFTPPAHTVVGTNNPTYGGGYSGGNGSNTPQNTAGSIGGSNGGGYSGGGAPSTSRSGYSSGAVGVQGQAAPSPSPLPPPEVSINKPAGTFEAMNRALQSMNPQSAYMAKPLTNASPYGPATNQGDVLKRLRRYVR